MADIEVSMADGIECLLTAEKYHGEEIADWWCMYLTDSEVLLSLVQ